MNATVFLGGGRITGALISGLRLAKYAAPIVVYDRHPEKIRQLKKLYGIRGERSLQAAVGEAGLLIVAVRPASVADLLGEIGKLQRPLVVVSLAAGIPLANLRIALGAKVRWARAMPSPLSRNGNGLTALTFDRGFPRAARRRVSALFARVGAVLEIPERQFDAFTVTYSSSHGYHALSALASEAHKLGLNRKIAMLAAAHGLADGIVAWREGGASLEALLDEAATPGGIAAATQSAAREAGYGRAVEAGLAAGMTRAKRNAKLKSVKSGTLVRRRAS